MPEKQTKRKPKSTNSKVTKKSPNKTVELPKNPQEYSYEGHEDVIIPASLFLLLYRANDKALNSGISRKFPTVTEWVSIATGAEVDKPTATQIQAGEVRQVMSIEKTFQPGNIQETFEDWMYPEVIQVKEALIDVHSRMVETGVATKITDLQAKAAAKLPAEEVEDNSSK